jgi:hypothetical protein
MGSTEKLRVAQHMLLLMALMVPMTLYCGVCKSELYLPKEYEIKPVMPQLPAGELSFRPESDNNDPSRRRSRSPSARIPSSVVSLPPSYTEPTLSVSGGSSDPTYRPTTFSRPPQVANHPGFEMTGHFVQQEEGVAAVAIGMHHNASGAGGKVTFARSDFKTTAETSPFSPAG